MAKRYVFVRMPEEVYIKYHNVHKKMESDIQSLTGRPLRLTMPQTFNAIISPEMNRNFIEVDLQKLVRLAKSKRGKYE